MSPSTATRENRELACEMKFLITPAVADQIRLWARNTLSPDPNAEGDFHDCYRITSLYCDTRSFDVFHRRGSFGRGKLRIRRYQDGPVVFLERKLRTRRLLSKRRSVLPIGELSCLARPELDERWSGYWFHRRLQLRAVWPVCQVTYLRTARVAMTPYGPIRLTVDEGLSGLPVTGPKFEADHGRGLLPGKTVLEMKFLVAMPTLFKGLIEEFALNPVSFSKYRHSAEALGLARSEQPNPVSCPTVAEKAYA